VLKWTPDFRERVRGATQGYGGRSTPGRFHRRLILFLAALTTIAFCVPLPEAPAQPRISEYAVKAAYLLNFGKFVRVPGGVQRGAFNICIVGLDPFGRSLDDITSNESIDGRPVRVLRLSGPDAARGCSIAYIGSTETRRISEDIAVFGAADVLTVSDAPDFLQHGGMIQFVFVSNHVRFSVNLDAVRHSHVVLSSELLRVAVSVTGGSGPGQGRGNGEAQP
jgi:hypothetical protein